MVKVAYNDLWLKEQSLEVKKPALIINTIQFTQDTKVAVTKKVLEVIMPQFD